MKIFHPFTVIVLSICSIIFSSCKKDASSQTINNNIIGQNEDGSVMTETTGSTVTLTLRPGLGNGQDTYVSKILDQASDGNANLNSVYELAIGANPSEEGDLAVERSYIRFDSLSKIPSTATIISARLYLYGESSSAVFPSIGNSYFTGSTNPANNCLVKRVTGGSWKQGKLTWNTMPATTNLGAAELAASTSQWNYNAVVNVQRMVAQIVSSGINYGFCIQLADEQSLRTMLFSTSENSSINLRPKLVVQYQ